MDRTEKMTELISLFVGMALINNFILVKFLGLCPFFGVSKKLSSAVSMGAAVTFVMFIASIATWTITEYILIPFEVEFMKIVIYILVIASLVQIIELFVMRTNYALYNAFGIYLALITTNCAVMGITLLNAQQSYSFLESIVAALGAGIGFTLVLAIMSGIRERLEMADSPKSMKGLPIAFITAMLLGLAFFGFGGII
jgi:electron transport complex protein RnfA